MCKNSSINHSGSNEQTWKWEQDLLGYGTLKGVAESGGLRMIDFHEVYMQHYLKQV